MPNNFPNFNNGFNNMSQEDLQNQMRNFIKNFRTKASIKWSLIFIIGVFPMMVCWILFGGADGTNKIFSSDSSNPSIIEISMGFQWLVALIVSAGSFFTTYFIVKYNKEVKGDVFGNIFAFGWIIINFWLFPIGNWRWLTLPFVYLFTYIFAQIVRFIIFIIDARKKALKAQKMMDEGKNPFEGKISDEQFKELKKRFDDLDKNNKHKPK